ncbi:MAG TPA: hypothetical protein VHB79_25955 [Polyangiaceae bacterium]|nr:hypothetical protein [Polyangiaceae bacterium]
MPSAEARARIDNRCERLSGADYEELDARVQLLLASEGAEQSVPAVVCSKEEAWVEWRGARFPILGRGSIVDEVVDIVEAQLHGAQRRAEADPKTTEDRAVASGRPMLEAGLDTPAPPVAQAADTRAARAADARGGGVSISVEAELPAGSLPWAVGPAFDFGATVGPVIVGGREAFRWTTSGRQVALMDFEGSVAYGAPLNPDALLGAVLRFGAEWMVAYPQGNSGQADVVPEIDFGVRIAHSFGSVGLWFGADARFRLGSLALHQRDPLVANDVGAVFALGASYVDWSRK